MSQPRVKSTSTTSTEVPTTFSRYAVPEIVEKALADTPSVANGSVEANEVSPEVAEKWLDKTIKRIDQSVDALVNEIVNTNQFRTLEAIWAETIGPVMDQNGIGVEHQLINQCFESIKDDLNSAGPNKKNSAIFREVVRKGYLTPGGQPTALLRVHDPIGLQDLEHLLELGGFGEYAHFNVIGQAKPELLIPGGQSFAEMSLDTAILKDDAANDDRLTEVKRFRQDPRSRRVVLGGPRYLSRKPHRRDDGATFDEQITVDSAPWGSLATVLEHLAAASYTKYGKFSQISGEFAGGKHKVPVVLDDYGRQHQVMETAICDDLVEKAVSDLGFLIAEPYLKAGYLVMFRANSMFNAPEGSLDADLSYRMINDQVAWDLKRLLRASLGLKLTAQKAKDLIEGYVRAVYCSASSVAVASFGELAMLPLSNVEVEVAEPQPGVFAAVVELFPHVNTKGFVVTTALKPPKLTVDSK